MEMISSRRITVSEMAPHIHTFLSGENRVLKIANWLIDWIKSALKSGKINPYDFLPLKGDLAFHIGVSIGTMQSVFRYVEDYGIVESKQRVGTYIKPLKEHGANKKLTSKRDVACYILKKYIKNNCKIGEKLNSTGNLSLKLGISKTTIRTAINKLLQEKVLVKSDRYFIIERLDFELNSIKHLTLVEKIAQNIKQSIDRNYSAGEKIPTNSELAKKYNVSLKTIHDALKLLIKSGIVVTKRGKYGTIVVDNNSVINRYYYEEIEQELKKFIEKNCEIGTKLPAIKLFAKKYNVSTKTIKKALDNLNSDGYVAFSRGRYGGTFVTDIPQSGNDAYTWLAISPDYIQTDEN